MSDGREAIGCPDLESKVRGGGERKTEPNVFDVVVSFQLPVYQLL